MYKHLDKLLKRERQKVKVEFNRLSVTGFDELNVTNTRKATQAMYDGFLKDNETMYLKAAKAAYKKAVSTAKAEDYSGKEAPPDGGWLLAFLLGYNYTTGYLYHKEAERKRLRLNEQMLTAREYNDRTMYRDSLRKSANLWWTQTAQYGIGVVDEATVKGFKDMGVKKVRWVAADDEKTCKECNERDDKVYDINAVPHKPHYGCRCYIVPVRAEV